MRPIWTAFDPRVTLDMLGEVPYWLDDTDPDSAKQQIHKNYGHGGGWQHMDGFIVTPGRVLRYPRYPDDPPLRPLAEAKLRDELIVFYPVEIFAIFQPDGSFEVARLD